MQRGGGWIEGVRRVVGGLRRGGGWIEGARKGVRGGEVSKGR